MSAAVLDRRPVVARGKLAVGVGLPDIVADDAPCVPVRDGITLGQASDRAWEALVAHRVADCIVCGGEMAPHYGASGHAPVGGRCVDCGASLS